MGCQQGRGGQQDSIELGEEDGGNSYPKFFQQVEYTVALTAAAPGSTRHDTKDTHDKYQQGANNHQIFATWYGHHHHHPKKKNKNGSPIIQEEYYTFDQIWKKAGSIAYYLRFECKLERGDRVILVYDILFSRLHFFVVFLGCLRAGIIPILVDYYHPPPAATAITETATSITNDMMASTTSAVSDVFGSITAASAQAGHKPPPTSTSSPLQNQQQNHQQKASTTSSACPFIQFLIHLQRVIQDCNPALILTDTMVNNTRKADKYNIFSKTHNLWDRNLPYLVTDTIVLPTTTATTPGKNKASSNNTDSGAHPVIKSPEDVFNMMMIKANESINDTATLLSGGGGGGGSNNSRIRRSHLIGPLSLSHQFQSTTSSSTATTSNTTTNHHHQHRHQHETRQYQELDTTSKDIAFIQYTSGTTTRDRPKAVAISFASLWANITLVGQNTLSKVHKNKERDSTKTPGNVKGRGRGRGEPPIDTSSSSPPRPTTVVGASWLLPHDTNITGNLIASFVVPFAYGWRQHYIMMPPTISSSSSSSSFPSLLSSSTMSSSSSLNDHVPLLHPYHRNNVLNNMNHNTTTKGKRNNKSRKKKKKKMPPLLIYFELLAKTRAKIGYLPVAAAVAAADDSALQQLVVQPPLAPHITDTDDKQKQQQPEKEEELDFSALRGIILDTGGEPMHPDSRRKMVAAFRKCGLPPKSFLSCSYGLAESVSGVCFLSTSTTTNDDDDHSLLSSSSSKQATSAGVTKNDNYCHNYEKWKPTDFLASGYRREFHPSVSLKVVDPDTCTEITTEGQAGELWISGPTTRNYYYNHRETTEELTKETFHAHLRRGTTIAAGYHDRRIPYLRTGDLAFFHGDDLFICGHMKDKIILNTNNQHGTNHHQALLVLPQDIEYRVQESSPLVQPGCVAAFSSSTTTNSEKRGGSTNHNNQGSSSGGTVEIVFEVCNEGKDQARDICRHVRSSIAQTMGFVPSRVVAIEQDSIPKTVAGVAGRRKIKRHITQQQLHHNELRVLFDLKSIGWLRETMTSMCHHHDHNDPSSRDKVSNSTGESTSTTSSDPNIVDHDEDPKTLRMDYEDKEATKTTTRSSTIRKKNLKPNEVVLLRDDKRRSRRWTTSSSRIRLMKKLRKLWTRQRRRQQQQQQQPTTTRKQSEGVKWQRKKRRLASF